MDTITSLPDETCGPDTPENRPLTPRQARVRAVMDAQAERRDHWVANNPYFHASDRRYLRFLIPEGARVLALGCGTGDVLASVKPSFGVGLDISPEMIREARRRFPDFVLIAGNLEDPEVLARLGGPFDYILVGDAVGYMDDCEATFAALHALCTTDTRIIVSYHGRLWEPLLRLAERVGQKMPQPEGNWLSTLDTMALMDLAGYEPIRVEWRQLLPKRLFGLGPLVNATIAPLPGIRRLCLRHYIVARPKPRPAPDKPAPSVTVLIPCRNERGNIENAVRRLPRLASDMEIMYVEGHSSDGTYEECLRVRDAYPELDIKVLRQDGKGKGDAVRKGFGAARGDILMILDADLTVAPETLPKFYAVIADGRAEFVNGTRLVYPMETGAMRRLNYIANRMFAQVFSFLLNQRFTDTLCGTKVVRRTDYHRIVANRGYFGDFDPFGDFDLIFGAAKLNLKIAEVPVRYADRTYGEPQISRFSDGWLLLRMVAFAWRKLKVV